MSARASRFARRLPGAAAVIGAAVLAGFVASRALPGDPVQILVEGQAADAELVARLRAEAGLDQPLPVQFAAYALGLLSGDFGRSFRYGGVPAGPILGEALPVTLGLMAGAAAIAVPLGIVLGTLAAGGRRAWPGALLTVAAVLAMSVPPLVLATWLMLAAPGGAVGAGAAVAAVLTLALPATAVIARMTRAQVAEALGHGCIRTARAKGLGWPAVLLRHALPNALVPLAAVAGSVTGAFLTAAAAVESVFALPGAGWLGVQAVLARDHPLAGAVVLVFVLLQVGIGLAVDLLMGLADPRLRDRREQP